MKEDFSCVLHTLVGRQHCGLFILYSRKNGTEKARGKHLMVWLSLRKLTSANLGNQKGNIIDKFYRQRPTQKQRQWFEGNSWKFCTWMEVYVPGGTRQKRKGQFYKIVKLWFFS
jgi:hypothetical protein